MMGEWAQHRRSSRADGRMEASYLIPANGGLVEVPVVEFRGFLSQQSALGDEGTMEIW